MIIGEFDPQTGEPFVVAYVYLPRLKIRDSVQFLLDTGAGSTLLHPEGARKLEVPFDKLENEVTSRGVGGTSKSFSEPAFISFGDRFRDRLWLRSYAIDLSIAEPNEVNEKYPSLLGRNITDRWRIEYDPADSKLQCTVRYADLTLFG